MILNKTKLPQLKVWWEKNNTHIAKPKQDWLSQARPNQLPPEGDWNTWLILAGRGFGKTRAGAEAIRMAVESGQHKHIGLIGQTWSEAQNVMVFGESGILSVCRHNPPTWQAQQLHWQNGAKARLYSGDHLDKLRGPQFDLVWIDEWAKFRNPEALWNQVHMTLRLGKASTYDHHNHTTAFCFFSQSNGTSGRCCNARIHL